MTEHLRVSVSNGVPREQALIRRWWHEVESARGRLVWEYHLEGLFADAIWFPRDPNTGTECDGKKTSKMYPLAGAEVVMCEAKLKLSFEVIGQALLYTRLAQRAGATVLRTIVFAETGELRMVNAAKLLGLWVVVGGRSPEPPTAGDLGAGSGSDTSNL